jgi:hypothetical protein
MATKTKLVSNPDHHFVRHCKNSQLIRENGAVIGVYPEAFELRAAGKYPEEKWLSGQYYEFYEGTHDEKLCACCHFTDIEMKRKDALCRMNVGKIKEQGQKRSKALRVQHQPEPAAQGDIGSPGYSGLHGLPKASEPKDDELLSLLAKLATIEITEISAIL